MKKGLIIVIAIVAVIAILGGSLVSSYNGLVEKQADVENADAQIQVQLQRRADLIPNLVNTVKGYEKSWNLNGEEVTLGVEKK